MRSKALLLSALLLPTLMIAGCHKGGDAKTDTVAEAPPEPPIKNDYSVFDSTKGQPVPDNEIVGPDGAKTTLKSVIGKPFLLLFWNTNEQKSVVELRNADKMAGETGLKVIALNTNQRPSDTAPDEATPVIAARKLKNVLNYRDPQLNVYHAMNGPVLPQAYLYNSKGNKVLDIFGPADFNSNDVREVLKKAQ